MASHSRPLLPLHLVATIADQVILLLILLESLKENHMRPSTSPPSHLLHSLLWHRAPPPPPPPPIPHSHTHTTHPSTYTHTHNTHPHTQAHTYTHMHTHSHTHIHKHPHPTAQPPQLHVRVHGPDLGHVRGQAGRRVPARGGVAACVYDPARPRHAGGECSRPAPWGGGPWVAEAHRSTRAWPHSRLCTWNGLAACPPASTAGLRQSLRERRLRGMRAWTSVWASTLRHACMGRLSAGSL